ncbi:MAG: class I SAM-dependent methyltransferase [Marmoricola sp.]
MDAHAWDERYAAQDLVWSAEPNRFVAEELTALEPGRAVDLACGEGRNAIWLASRGWQVTALDFSGVALDKGRRLAGDLPVDWLNADATTWSEPGAYDLALLAYLQLPAEERGRAVRNALAAVRSGGTFFLIAHDSTNLAEGTGGPQDPRVLYSAEDVLADLEHESFEVVRADRVAREVTAADEHGGEARRTAYDALVHLIKV